MFAVLKLNILSVCYHTINVYIILPIQGINIEVLNFIGNDVGIYVLIFGKLNQKSSLINHINLMTWVYYESHVKSGASNQEVY